MKARDMPGTLIYHLNFKNNIIRKKVFAHCTHMKSEDWRDSLSFPEL